MDLQPLKIDRSSSAARKRRGRLGRLVGWAVFLAVIVGLGWLFRSPLGGLLDRLRLPEVEVVRVTRTSRLAATAVSGTAANGYIVASKRAALSADTPGRIVEMNVTEGSVVRKGDVVARLYADEYRADLRSAEADLEAARFTVERTRADLAVSAAEIVRLESSLTAFEAAVREARAAADLAVLTLERARGLAELDFESRQRVDEAVAERDRSQAAHEAAEANLETGHRSIDEARARQAALEAGVAEAQARLPGLAARRDRAAATLDKTEVRAPFDGIVVLKDAEVGEVVSPNSLGGNSRGSVVTMVDFDSLEVQVELPETSLTAVEIGGPVQIFLDAFPDVLYAGRVERIWPTANRQKATVEVRVGFEVPDERLRPEMGVRAVFSPEGAEPTSAASSGGEGEQPERILIPADSVVKIEGRSGVFVLERDVARFRVLELGEERSGRVLVRSGLEGGETIVARPPTSLFDGERVRVKG